MVPFAGPRGAGPAEAFVRRSVHAAKVKEACLRVSGTFHSDVLLEFLPAGADVIPGTSRDI